MGGPKPIPNGYKFLFAGCSGMLATVVVQPLDLLKNRMQMSGEGGKTPKQYKSSYHLLMDVVKNEGVLSLYNGLSAGVLRQATYTTTRLGIYTWLLELATKEGKPPSYLIKTILGMFAGICGAFVGTPSDVALIRMTTDGRLPPEQRRNYKHIFDALIKMWQEGGTATLFKGAVPTMGRAMVVNGAQLGTYSQAKESLLATERFNEGIFLHFCASMISGLVTATASLPVDIVKTRIQNKKTEAGKKEANAMEVIVAIIKNEGIFALWKGFTPYYFRIGPHTVLIFVFLEQFNSLYRRLSKD